MRVPIVSILYHTGAKGIIKRYFVALNGETQNYAPITFTQLNFTQIANKPLIVYTGLNILFEHTNIANFTFLLILYMH